MAEQRKASKEVFATNGELFRYQGDAHHGLSIECAEREVLTLSPDKIDFILRSFSGYNPLLQHPRKFDETSLERFIAWAGSSGSLYDTRPTSKDTAQRVLIVLMGEGLLPMSSSYGPPFPGEFPAAPVEECLSQLVGRTAAFVDRPMILSVQVAGVTMEPQEFDGAYAELRLLTQEVFAAAAVSVPEHFTIGSEVGSIEGSVGSFSAPYLSWQLVTAPALVEEIWQLSRTHKERRELLSAIRDIA